MPSERIEPLNGEGDWPRCPDTIEAIDPAVCCDLPAGHPLPHRESTLELEWVSTRDG